MDREVFNEVIGFASPIVLDLIYHAAYKFVASLVYSSQPGESQNTKSLLVAAFTPQDLARSSLVLFYGPTKAKFLLLSSENRQNGSRWWGLDLPKHCGNPACLNPHIKGVQKAESPIMPERLKMKCQTCHYQTSWVHKPESFERSSNNGMWMPFSYLGDPLQWEWQAPKEVSILLIKHTQPDLT
jgi:hypothetical protein